MTYVRDDVPSTELLRRAMLWLGALFALTADLVLLGLPVLPAAFYWHDGLKVAAVLAMLLGLAGLFAPMWRRVTREKHDAILFGSGIPAVFALFLLSATGWCTPIWWFEYMVPYLMGTFSLAGAACALATAIWPHCGWRRWFRRKLDRLPHSLRMRLYGPRYGDY